MLQMVWGWQPALYLFLGGMGAGAFVASSALYLTDNEHHKTLICGAMWASVISLCVGLLLLLLELTQPLRGLMMWQSFSHFSSWMTLGAWGLFASVVVFGVSAILATIRVVKSGKSGGNAQGRKTVERVFKALAIVGIFLGAFVAVYTGVLLMMAPGVPLWNTWLLPCLFTVSAFDTGVALVEIIAVVTSRKEGLTQKAHRYIEATTVVLIVLECFVMAVFLSTMLGANASTSTGAAAQAASEMLVSGALAPYFWILVIAVGLVLPLVLAVVGLASRKSKSKAKTALMGVGAIAVLVGGCELRFLVLAAGLHADVVAGAVAGILAM